MLLALGLLPLACSRRFDLFLVNPTRCHGTVEVICRHLETLEIQAIVQPSPIPAGSTVKFAGAFSSVWHDRDVCTMEFSHETCGGERRWTARQIREAHFILWVDPDWCPPSPD